MRIFVANYRYFVSGGPERYMFNVSEGFTKRGHEIIPFSIRYSRNHRTPYEQYFVTALGSEDQVYFQEQKFTPKTVWRTLSRLFYASDVERAVTKLISDTQPQVAYVLHYLRKLSPSLLVALKKAGLPIVVRLSDFAMLCPQAHCLRNGKPCELCVHGNLLPSVRYRCVQKSFAASALNAFATFFHRFKRYFDLIDVFVTTNEFMYKMMISAGFSEDRLRCIPTFVDNQLFSPNRVEHDKYAEPYIAYVGRLEPLKGIDVLLHAWKHFRSYRPDSSLRLRIAGFGEAGYQKHLQETSLKLELDRVEFIGRLDKERVAKFLKGAILSVLPSLWYENLPNSLLESYACGTPVLASNIGSLSESVTHKKTGMLFEAGDAGQLAEKLMFCLDNPEQLSLMSKQARQVALADYSQGKHLNKLESLFSELLNCSGGITDDIRR